MCSFQFTPFSKINVFDQMYRQQQQNIRPNLSLRLIIDFNCSATALPPFRSNIYVNKRFVLALFTVYNRSRSLSNLKKLSSDIG